MMKRLNELWCEVMHNSAMWPIHGHYECRTCGRQYPVSWEGHAPEGTARPVVTWTLAGASK